MFIMFIVYVYICTHHPNTESDHWQDMKVAQHLNTQVFLATGAMHKSHLCVQVFIKFYEHIKIYLSFVQGQSLKQIVYK